MKNTAVVSSEDYVMWSDGVLRSPRWHPRDHALREAIRLMFQASLDEQILAARWDLEARRNSPKITVDNVRTLA